MLSQLRFKKFNYLVRDFDVVLGSVCVDITRKCFSLFLFVAGNISSPDFVLEVFIDEAAQRFFNCWVQCSSI